MKNVIIKILAVVLLAWYSMSIIGFDVHTCRGSGRSFVVTFVEGLACSDIHPEHKCDASRCCAAHHSCCCGHEHELPQESFSSSSCCSDDYQVLSITGTAPTESNRNADECSLAMMLCIPVYAEMDSAIDKREKKHLQHQHMRYSPAADSQAFLRIWRI